MSVAYYIILDTETPGFDTFVNGKAIAHADDLEAFCAKCGLPALESFVSQSREELEDMLEEDVELPEGESDDAQWFDAEEGVNYVDALIAALRKEPDALEATADVIDDLLEYKAVLEQAQAIDAKWRLAPDF